MRCRQRSETRKRIPGTYLKQFARNAIFRLKIIERRQRNMRGQEKIKKKKTTKHPQLPRSEITGSWSTVISIAWGDSKTNLAEMAAILRTYPTTWKKEKP